MHEGKRLFRGLDDVIVIERGRKRKILKRLMTTQQGTEQLEAAVNFVVYSRTREETRNRWREEETNCIQNGNACGQKERSEKKLYLAGTPGDDVGIQATRMGITE